MDTKEKYIREAMHQFVVDPPDTDFQMGYLAALVSVAIEAMGIPGHDPDVLAATNSTPHTTGFDPALARQALTRFKIIDGGKEAAAPIPHHGEKP